MTPFDPAGRSVPNEPVLDMEEIQGIAVPGFFKPHQTLLYLRIPDGVNVVQNFKGFLRGLKVSSARLTLDDRRSFRERKSKLSESAARETNVVLTAVAFSYLGMHRLTPGADAIPSAAFRHGLLERSALLGDPVSADKEGHPSKWVVGAPGQELDALIIVAGTERPTVSATAAKYTKALEALGITVDSQDGDIRADDRGHEHFGFDDGVSQPGIRGRASDNPNDFITDRHLPQGDFPNYWLFGYPGQDLVWPGEFVLGYPATSPDPLLPGPVAEAYPEWARNGSFLVYRRLRQDVGLFWRTMRAQAEKLSSLPGFAGVDDDWLAARLVGRWPSGAPVSRVPGGDDEDLGKDKLANNNFLFDSDTPKQTGKQAQYHNAKADPVGLTCPMAAHIRKLNTRDSASDMGARSSIYERRLLRVGVPFGKSLAPKGKKKGGPKPITTKYSDDAEDPEHGNRGLLFLSIQSSIEEQFEFLQSRWINDPGRPRMPSGNDMLVGQNAPAAGAIRRCTIFGTGLQQSEVSADKQWVIPTGGGYFFVPSISALREVLGT